MPGRNRRRLRRPLERARRRGWLRRLLWALAIAGVVAGSGGWTGAAGATSRSDVAPATSQSDIAPGSSRPDAVSGVRQADAPAPAYDAWIDK